MSFSFEIDIENRFANRCFNPILDIIKRFNGENIQTLYISEDCLTVNFVIYPDNPNSVNVLFELLINRYPYIDCVVSYNYIIQQEHICQSSNQYFTDAMYRAEEEEKDDV